MTVTAEKLKDSVQAGGDRLVRYRFTDSVDGEIRHESIRMGSEENADTRGQVRARAIETSKPIALQQAQKQIDQEARETAALEAEAAKNPDWDDGAPQVVGELE